MIGGLSNTSSRLALVAAAGLFMGGVAMPSAKAADLGGDCCADLEERVAELEATTARKGNRKVSLTITGQLNRMIMFWDDGHTHGIYYGIDNVNSSSRFSFLGEASATPWLKFGFEIMIEGESTSGSTRVSQLNEDGSFSATTYLAPIGTSGVNNAGNSDSFFGDARRVAAWAEHKEIGRVTVGRYETAGAMGTIDLGGIGVVAGFGSMSLLQGNFFLRLSDGSLTNSVWSQFLDPSAYQSRQETLRYDSPAIHGFIFSASVSEASGGFNQGSNWGVMLRYAGEHHGFRVAAGIGYDHTGDLFTPTSVAVAASTTGGSVTPGLNLVGASPFTLREPNVNAWGVALSLMHIHTGLFLQGSYQSIEFNNSGSTTSGYWGEACDGSTSAGSPVLLPGTAPAGTGQCNPKKDASWWQIQGGIAKNWTGWGNTILYGEYGRFTDWGAEQGGRNFTSGSSPQTFGFAAISNVKSTDATVWGVGLVQNFNNAATEWYLGYRNFALDLNADAICTRGTPNAAAPGVAAGAGTCSISDFNLVVTGLRVKF